MRVTVDNYKDFNLPLKVWYSIPILRGNDFKLLIDDFGNSNFIHKYSLKQKLEQEERNFEMEEHEIIRFEPWGEGTSSIKGIISTHNIHNSITIDSMDNSDRWRVFTTREEAEEWSNYIPPLWEYPEISLAAKMVLDKKFPDGEWEELMLNQEWEKIETSMNPTEFIMCKEDLDILKNDKLYTNYKESL